MGTISGVLVIRDQREGAAVVVGGSHGTLRDRLAGMVNGDLVLIAQAAEELAIVGDCVVQVAGHLDRGGMLFLDERLDVLLGLLHVLRRPSHLDVRAFLALSGDVDNDRELGLNLASGLATTADQRPVLVLGNINRLRDLAGTLVNKLLDRLRDGLDKRTTAFDLDSGIVAVLVRELNGPRQLSAVIRASSLDNEILDSRA